MDKYTQIIRDPKRLSALRRLLLLDTPPEPAYDRITRLAARILKVPVAFLTLVDEDRQFFKSQFGLPEPWASRRETPLSHSFCQYTITSDEPLVVSDARQHPVLQHSAAIPELSMIGYAGVPVFTSDGHALGAFCVSTPEPHEWSDEDVATLKDLAQSMATEIELHGEIRLRRRLGDALSQQLDMMTTMYKLSAELTHQLSQEFVVAIALDAALRFTRADCGYIALIEGGQLKVVEMIGPYDEAQLEAYLRQQPNRGLIARVLGDRQPVLLEDVTADPDYEPLIETTVALAIIPLVSHDRVIGVVGLETREKDQFTEDYLDFLLLLNSRVAAAIDNARLYEVAQQRMEELQRANIQLTELEQLKTQIIDIAAHDLRNPLGAVHGYIELVREQHEAGGLKKDLTYFLDMMDGSVKQMRHITDDILSMQRVENMLHNEVDVVNLSDLASSRLNSHRYQAEQEGLDISMTVAPEVSVRADPVFLGEAISNFITNAIKYTPAGGKITVRLSQLEGCARLEVEDTGLGIPEKDQDKLFQPFSRVRNRNTMMIEGTGLGLYLVKQIVEGYGGRTYFESVEGKGSTFGFELPLASEEVAAG